MKCNKQMMTLLLSAALMLTVFAGCGKAKTETAQAPSETAAAQPAEEPSAPPAAKPTAGPEPEPVTESYEFAVREVKKRGNVVLDTSFEAMKEINIEPADIISVSIGDQTFDFPVGTSFTDVDVGEMLCRFDVEDAEVALAVNGGSFAETVGMAVKETIDEEPGYRWDLRTDTVTVSLKEKGGYQDEYAIRNLERTNERADYGALSDAEFANCRVVDVPGIKPDVIYRGTTPLDTDMGRNTYAMAFLEENGVRTILNLADSAGEMTAFESYADSYYAACRIRNAEMAYDYASESFAAKVAECFRFILENDGPYYIHCKEGKDRTGIFCAILECFVGAGYEDVENDYMLTYFNFYHVEKGSGTYDAILRTNLTKSLCELFGISDPAQANLEDEAEAYLLSAGLTPEELASLRTKLTEKN